MQKLTQSCNRGVKRQEGGVLGKMGRDDGVPSQNLPANIYLMLLWSPWDLLGKKLQHPPGASNIHDRATQEIKAALPHSPAAVGPGGPSHRPPGSALCFQWVIIPRAFFLKKKKKTKRSFGFSWILVCGYWKQCLGAVLVRPFFRV